MRTDQKTAKRDDEDKHVSSHRVIVSTISFGKEEDHWVQFVLA
jgi:hypothetical protein